MIKKLILPQSIQRNKNTQRTHQSQFPQRLSFGVLLRKTAVSFPCEETAASLSTSFFLTPSKVRAHSVSEGFFLSSTHSLSRMQKKRKTMPACPPRRFPEQHFLLIFLFESVPVRAPRYFPEQNSLLILGLKTMPFRLRCKFG